MSWKKAYVASGLLAPKTNKAQGGRNTSARRSRMQVAKASES